MILIYLVGQLPRIITAPVQNCSGSKSTAHYSREAAQKRGCKKDVGLLEPMIRLRCTCESNHRPGAGQGPPQLRDFTLEANHRRRDVRGLRERKPRDRKWEGEGGGR